MRPGWRPDGQPRARRLTPYCARLAYGCSTLAYVIDESFASSGVYAGILAIAVAPPLLLDRFRKPDCRARAAVEPVNPSAAASRQPPA